MMTQAEALAVLRAVDISVEREAFATELVLQEHGGPEQFRLHSPSNAHALREILKAIEALSQGEE